VRGLWYFFGIVIAAGIFTGVIGLGVGHAVGLFWELIHRQRRRERLRGKVIDEAESAKGDRAHASGLDPVVSPLRLVTVDPPAFPVVTGRRLGAVAFHMASIELDFSGVRVRINGNPAVVCGVQRYRYPDPGSRDALCSLIGARVERVGMVTPERIDVSFDSGCDLVVVRSSIAVA
jgi:hypothetical protein